MFHLHCMPDRDLQKSGRRVVGLYDYILLCQSPKLGRIIRGKQLDGKDLIMFRKVVVKSCQLQENGILVTKHFCQFPLQIQTVTGHTIFFFLIFFFVFNILYLSVLKCDDSLCRSQVCRVFRFFRDDSEGDADHSINPWASYHLQPCNI